MSSRRAPRPLPALLTPDTSRRLGISAEAALAGLNRLADALEQIAAAGLAIADEISKAHPAPLLTSERLVVRSLGPEHLGRWITVDAPTSADPLSVRPAGDSGRLVGIRPGTATQSKLVLQQGPQILTIDVALTAIVRIGSAS